MPFGAFAVPLLVGGVAVLFMIWQRQQRKAALAGNAQHTLGAVAQRLGLRVVEGDPTLNFMYFQQPKFTYERQLRLEGHPYGRPVEFVLGDSVKNTVDVLVYREVTHSFGCRIAVATSVSLPEFEVARRNPNEYLRPLRAIDQNRAPIVPTGDPRLDQEFEVRSADPRVGPALVKALDIVSAELYVHFFGQGNRIVVNITRMALPYFAAAAERYLLALETIACSLEGRPAPASLLGAPVSATGT